MRPSKLVRFTGASEIGNRRYKEENAENSVSFLQQPGGQPGETASRRSGRKQIAATKMGGVMIDYIASKGDSVRKNEKKTEKL